MKRSRQYLLILLALLSVALAACGSGTKTTTSSTTTTAPAPPIGHAIPAKPGGVPAPEDEAVPTCNAKELAEIEAGRGSIGRCAPNPAPGTPPTSAVRRGVSGPDVSNNDPFFNWHPVKAHGHPFAYNKIIQGVRFVDSTAAGMAKAQRAAGIVPGGYDFLEVCRTSASGEARLYAARLKAIGLTGASHAFVPMGDAEWPLSVPCSASSARVWLLRWENTLHALIHRWPGFYTGAWWWDPNVGCWRPPHAVRWVSGYTLRRRLPIPCGWGGVDLWQYTDHGFNGVIHSDMSILETSASKFVGAPAPPPKPLTKPQARAKLRKVGHLLGAYDRRRNPHGHNCAHPPYRHAYPSARYNRACAGWAAEARALRKRVG